MGTFRSLQAFVHLANPTTSDQLNHLIIWLITPGCNESRSVIHVLTHFEDYITWKILHATWPVPNFKEVTVSLLIFYPWLLYLMLYILSSFFQLWCQQTPLQIYLDFSPNIFLVSIRFSTAMNWGLLNELALKKLITILYNANNVKEHSYWNFHMYMLVSIRIQRVQWCTYSK